MAASLVGIAAQPRTVSSSLHCFPSHLLDPRLASTGESPKCSVSTRSGTGRSKSVPGVLCPVRNTPRQPRTLNRKLKWRCSVLESHRRLAGETVSDPLSDRVACGEEAPADIRSRPSSASQQPRTVSSGETVSDPLSDRVACGEEAPADIRSRPLGSTPGSACAQPCGAGHHLRAMAKRWLLRAGLPPVASSDAVVAETQRRAL